MKKFRELKEEVSTPSIAVRSLYTKMYAKHGGTAAKAKDAQSKAYAEVEKKHGKEMRNSLEAFHKKNMNEAVKDKFDIGEYDQEGDMAKSDLRSILANAKRVHDMLEDSDNLPEWVQSKITKAEDYMSTVANYMEAEMNEEVELDEENKPTNPELWARAKSMAKSKFDVYPSAYANGWASKWYKSKGGGWRSVNEENYEVTVMHTTKDGEKGEHTHKVMNADDARHAKNIALEKHEKMLNNKGVEVRGMGTTTAKVMEETEVVVEGSAYDRINARFKKLSGKSLEDTAKQHKAESEKLAKEIKDQEEKNKKMKSEAVKDDLPFTPDKPKKKDIVAGKYGAGYSTAKSLAKQAMKKQMEKMKKPMKEEMTNKAKIVKNIMKNKNQEKFESEPIISKTVDDKES